MNNVNLSPSQSGIWCQENIFSCKQTYLCHNKYMCYKCQQNVFYSWNCPIWLVFWPLMSRINAEIPSDLWIRSRKQNKVFHVWLQYRGDHREFWSKIMRRNPAKFEEPLRIKYLCLRIQRAQFSCLLTFSFRWPT